MSGTSLLGTKTGTTWPVLTNATGLAIVALSDGAGDTTAGIYAVGCLLIRTDSANNYINTGTTASPSWAAVTHA